MESQEVDVNNNMVHKMDQSIELSMKQKQDYRRKSSLSSLFNIRDGISKLFQEIGSFVEVEEIVNDLCVNIKESDDSDVVDAVLGLLEYIENEHGKHGAGTCWHQLYRTCCEKLGKRIFELTKNAHFYKLALNDVVNLLDYSFKVPKSDFFVTWNVKDSISESEGVQTSFSPVFKVNLSPYHSTCLCFRLYLREPFSQEKSAGPFIQWIQNETASEEDVSQEWPLILNYSLFKIRNDTPIIEEDGIFTLGGLGCGATCGRNQWINDGVLFGHSGIAAVKVRLLLPPMMMTVCVVRKWIEVSKQWTEKGDAIRLLGELQTEAFTMGMTGSTQFIINVVQPVQEYVRRTLLTWIAQDDSNSVLDKRFAKLTINPTLDDKNEFEVLKSILEWAEISDDCLCSTDSSWSIIGPLSDQKLLAYILPNPEFGNLHQNEIGEVCNRIIRKDSSGYDQGRRALCCKVVFQDTLREEFAMHQIILFRDPSSILSLVNFHAIPYSDMKQLPLHFQTLLRSPLLSHGMKNTSPVKEMRVSGVRPRTFSGPECHTPMSYWERITHTTDHSQDLSISDLPSNVVFPLTPATKKRIRRRHSKTPPGVVRPEEWKYNTTIVLSMLGINSDHSEKQFGHKRSKSTGSLQPQKKSLIMKTPEDRTNDDVVSSNDLFFPLETGMSANRDTYLQLNGKSSEPSLSSDDECKSLALENK